MIQPGSKLEAIFKEKTKSKHLTAARGMAVYWLRHVYRNYSVKNGKKYVSPGFFCRIARCDCFGEARRVMFNLGTTNKQEAARRAAERFRYIGEYGWARALEAFNPRQNQDNGRSAVGPVKAELLLESLDQPDFSGAEKILYVVGASGLWKIGITEHWKSRLKKIQTDFPFELQVLVCRVYPGGRAVESLAHRVFADYRTQGEWFKVDAERIQEFFAWLKPPIKSLSFAALLSAV